VGIRENAIRAHHPAGAAPGAERAGQPRQAIVRVLHGVVDASDAFAEFTGLRAERGNEEAQGECDGPEAENHEAGKMDAGVRLVNRDCRATDFGSTKYMKRPEKEFARDSQQLREFLKKPFV
jgi:hypothetical protein